MSISKIKPKQLNQLTSNLSRIRYLPADDSVTIWAKLGQGRNYKSNRCTPLGYLFTRFQFWPFSLLFLHRRNCFWFI